VEETHGFYVTRWRPDSLAGAAGFEPLHLRIKFAKTLSSGREKSNMRISSKVVVPPPCQKKVSGDDQTAFERTRHVRPETGLAGSRDSEFSMFGYAANQQ
jgi:hypothetical protein